MFRPARFVVASLFAAVAAAACSPQGKDAAGAAATATISGVLVLAPGQSMPAGMPLEVDLVDVAPGQEAAGPAAKGRLASGTAAETPFKLKYDPARLVAGHPYMLRARAAIDGTTYLAGAALAPTGSGTPPFPVDVVLRRPPHASPLYLDVSVLRLDYKGTADWSARLRDVMPGMFACLRSVSGQGLAVSKAWTMPGGRVGVRIRGDDGNGFECVALADGSKFESLSGLPSFATALQGEGSPSFVPAPASPKMAACRRYERVLGGVDETLGWLVYDTCPPSPTAPQPASAPAAPAGAAPSA